MSSLLSSLQQYGFTEKEAKVYLAALELGNAPWSTIARQAGEKRVTAYAILKEFTKKWIATELIRNNVKYFSVILPEMLLKSLEDKYLLFKENIPELMAIAEKLSNRPKVQFFEGVEWIKKLFDDFSTTTIDMKTVIGTPKYHNDLLLPLSARYRAIRKQKWLSSKRIVSHHDTDEKKEKADDKLYKRQTVVVKNFPFNIKADINIYGPNKVSFLFFNGDMPHAVVIHSEPMYETLNALFDYIRATNNTKKK